MSTISNGSRASSATDIMEMPVAKKAKVEANADALVLSMITDDIIVQKIFPFLGPGHFAFVAGVCKKFKELYLIYFNSLKTAPEIRVSPFGTDRARASNTFFHAVFSSVACMEYWDSDTKGSECRATDELFCQKAARFGKLDALQWARQKGFKWDQHTCSGAAGSGNVEVLDWARKNGCPWTSSVWTAAIFRNRMEVLQYAHANKCPWDERAASFPCFMVAINGTLEVLKWARSKGYPWDYKTCHGAATSGKLEMLKYLRANDCPWEESTCLGAAWCGQLHVLKWAYKMGCPWEEQECRQAALESEHLDVVEWIDSGRPLDD